MSVLNAMIQCATLGLEPNTVMGHAYMIPYGKECTFIIGYKGMCDLARRHPSVVAIQASVVYSDDELFSYEYGTNRHLRHKPGPCEGEITHAYCHVTLKDGDAFAVLTRGQILKIRDASSGWKSAVQRGKTKSNPWTTHEDRMFRKTAIRALANGGEMPMSNEFHIALSVDDRAAPDTLPKFDDGDPLSGLTIDGTLAEEEDESPEAGSPTPPPTGGDREQKAGDAPKEGAPATPKPKPRTRKKAEPKKDGLTKDEAEALYNGLVAEAMDRDIEDLLADEKTKAALTAIQEFDPQMAIDLREELDEFREPGDGGDPQGSLIEGD